MLTVRIGTRMDSVHQTLQPRGLRLPSGSRPVGHLARRRPRGLLYTIRLASEHFAFTPNAGPLDRAHGQRWISTAASLAVGAAFLALWLYEEPTLRRKFGREYEEYCRHVPRWIPRLTPYDRSKETT